MKWNEYESNYIRIARLKEKKDEYCIKQLEYAKPLFEKNVPVIYNQEHFCKLVGYSEEYIYSAANKPQKFYRTFFIKKKNGTEREINEPLPSLKEIQYWILKEILDKVKISPYAKAYIKGRSIKENARFHKKQKKILSIDLKDFFPSIGFGRILHVFKKIGYRENVAVMLANLCYLKHGLPQGAPTSPALSNIVANTLDNMIVKYVSPQGIRYTRYADDLTFSGDFNDGDLIKNIERIVKRQGFLINKEKTRIRKRHHRQEVTGIVVNEKMQIARTIRHRIRSDIYYIQKFGLDSHIEKLGNNKNNYLYHLMGQVSYAAFINPYDEKLIEYIAILKKELNSHRE